MDTTQKTFNLVKQNHLTVKVFLVQFLASMFSLCTQQFSPDALASSY